MNDQTYFEHEGYDEDFLTDGAIDCLDGEMEEIPEEVGKPGTSTHSLERLSDIVEF